MRARYWLILGLLLLASCQGQTTGSQQSRAAPVAGATAVLVAPAAPAAPTAAATPLAAAPAAPTTAPTRAGPTAMPTPGPGQFVNPVLDIDFADPDLLKVGDTYYAYATNAANTNIQVARSKDLVRWETLGGALPALPLWAKPQFGLTWAPEVTTSADGKTYLMYFTTRDEASGKQCVGVATSDKPEGPFRPHGDKAFICQVQEGGTIDAAAFVDDDGSRYVLFKNDGNCCGLPTWLYIQRVSADGLTLEGQPTRLVQNDKIWEGRVVEAPTLWKHNGKYYLFYSANNYAGADYAIGYAVADKVLGPYQKPGDQPFVATASDRGPATLGPGGQDIVVDKDGETWLVYHAWDLTLTYRSMNIDELVWEGGKPVLKGPDRVPQVVP